MIFLYLIFINTGQARIYENAGVIIRNKTGKNQRYYVILELSGHGHKFINKLEIFGPPDPGNDISPMSAFGPEP